MPIVFCASLPPWPMLYIADDTSCSLRNQRSVCRCVRRRQIQDTATMMIPESSMPSSGATTMKDGLDDAGREQRAGAGLRDRGAHQAADQRVRRRRRQAVVPGDHVPGDGADQRAEDQVVVDERRVDDALADRGRDLEVEQHDRDEVEEGRPHHGLIRLQHAGRDDGRDRVRGVVEAVHEVERRARRRPA